MTKITVPTTSTVSTLSQQEDEEEEDEKISSEIAQLVNSPAFLAFVIQIQEELGDEVTFNEILSSPEIIEKAQQLLAKKITRNDKRRDKKALFQKS